MFLVVWFGSAGLIKILESFTTILYDLEKVVLFEKALFVPQNFVFSKGEGWNFLK